MCCAAVLTQLCNYITQLPFFLQRTVCSNSSNTPENITYALHNTINHTYYTLLIFVQHTLILYINALASLGHITQVMWHFYSSVRAQPATYYTSQQTSRVIHLAFVLLCFSLFFKCPTVKTLISTQILLLSTLTIYIVVWLLTDYTNHS